jgi:histidinol-phosphatase (PHP family)
VVLVTLPADGHVHSEWSWDAPDGSMERSCARAVEFGLPAIAFTEHVDQTVWTVAVNTIEPGSLLASVASADGVVTPPAFDAAGYLEAIERCRHRLPDLRILSGLELGEPHWHAGATAGVLGSGHFDRVLGSLHCLPSGDGFAEPPGLYERRPAAEVLRDYLAEISRLVTTSDARTGRALEINTVVPLHPVILRWWHDAGGEAVTFGSDAHEPSAIARGFRDAVQLAEAHGFRPGPDPYDFWARVD